MEPRCWPLALARARHRTREDLADQAVDDLLGHPRAWTRSVPAN
jgi:hypothetical protein